MEKVKVILRKWPGMYNRLQRMYYKLLYIVEISFLGTRIHEFIWKYIRGLLPIEWVKLVAE